MRRSLTLLALIGASAWTMSARGLAVAVGLLTAAAVLFLPGLVMAAGVIRWLTRRHRRRQQLDAPNVIQLGNFIGSSTGHPWRCPVCHRWIRAGRVHRHDGPLPPPAA